MRGFGRSAVPCLLPDTATVGLFEDAGALAAALRGQEVVFHLISSSLPERSNHDPADDIAREVIPTIQLLSLCRKAEVRRVVFASSGGTVYGVARQVPTPETAPTLPISAYGINKLTVERYLGLFHYLYGLEYQVLRVANPYGPGQSPYKRQGIIAVMLHRALMGGTIEIWGAGNVVRDFVHVDDVAAAFVAAASYDGPHRVMNVGSGQGRTLNQVAADVARVLELPNLSVVHRSARAVDVPTSVLDTSLIRQETACEPKVPWLNGLAGTAAWMRAAVLA